jgi:hypothetical protein
LDDRKSRLGAVVPSTHFKGDGGEKLYADFYYKRQSFGLKPIYILSGNKEPKETGPQALGGKGG